MVTRFSAKEVRAKAEKAQEIIEAERKQELKIKKEIAKKKAYVNAKFKEQRISMFEAAIDGKRQLELEEIYCYQDLLSLGFEVAEHGMVKSKKQTTISELKVIRAKENIYKELDELLEMAKSFARKYYGNFSNFRNIQYEELKEVINSRWKVRRFVGDEIFSNKIPVDVKKLYLPKLENLNSKLDFYRSVKEYYENQDDFNPDAHIEKLANGKFIFGKYDYDVDILEPGMVGNKLTISWQSDSHALYMNEPLFSANGLSWLSGDSGQTLFGEIFKALDNAAERAKKLVKFEFSLSENGWDFEGDFFKFRSCSPDEIVELISIHDFTILDTQSSKNSYVIKVTW